MKQYSIYPLQDSTIFDMYCKSQDVFWTQRSINYSNDDYDSLKPSEQNMLKKILFFFANADKLVADNILENFTKLDLPKEADLFLGFQVMNEQVHAVTYGDAIEAYIKDLKTKEEAYNAIYGSDFVASKLNWMRKWVESGEPVNALLAFIIVESIFFSSTFAAIFWMKELGWKLNGFFDGNSEILRDEVSHYEFSTYIWNNYYKNALDKDTIFGAIRDAVDTECQYIDYILGQGVNGIDGDKLKKYVRHIANIVVTRMGFDTIYDSNETDHGLRFMDKLGIQATVNFFEKDSKNYTKISGSVDKIDFDNF